MRRCAEPGTGSKSQDSSAASAAQPQAVSFERAVTVPMDDEEAKRAEKRLLEDDLPDEEMQAHKYHDVEVVVADVLQHYPVPEREKKSQQVKKLKLRTKIKMTLRHPTTITMMSRLTTKTL